MYGDDRHIVNAQAGLTDQNYINRELTRII